MGKESGYLLFSLWKYDFLSVLVFSEEVFFKIKNGERRCGQKNDILIQKRKQCLRFPSIYLTQKDSTFTLSVHALSYKRKKVNSVSPNEFSWLPSNILWSSYVFQYSFTVLHQYSPMWICIIGIKSYGIYKDAINI